MWRRPVASRRALQFSVVGTFARPGWELNKVYSLRKDLSSVLSCETLVGNSSGDANLCSVTAVHMVIVARRCATLTPPPPPVKPQRKLIGFQKKEKIKPSQMKMKRLIQNAVR